MISLTEIFKTYQIAEDKINVLNNINLTVERGDFFAITGPSGSGKTTLMNIIGCLDKPSSGTFMLDNINIMNCNEQELARVRNLSIGFVFQNFHLLPRMSVIENIHIPMVYAGVPKKERDSKAKIALEKVGLLEKANFLPSEISGGQKQRVAIARAIVNEPEIILADEPTGALDTETSMTIMNHFLHLNNEGTTIIVVTHEKDIASFANNQIVVRDGSIVNTEAPHRKDRLS
ncbi:ABC transporter ATP-binding protein [Pontibacillus salipaludis]|uniref:ABC transporter ATP-binding protein YknY n=1 Tax=Pontibacillus salipaludis TaxID=1697394 RepID=A0ABQ1QJC4_9BACI|nr:ABC transporter ATP-binding protein [Pontibacillus salipaludis]GGD29081.1 putative ABC transporter ATP-binding protein YknY [Pontibacillus salipaludis]